MSRDFPFDLRPAPPPSFPSISVTPPSRKPQCQSPASDWNRPVTGPSCPKMAAWRPCRAAWAGVGTDRHRRPLVVCGLVSGSHLSYRRCPPAVNPGPPTGGGKGVRMIYFGPLTVGRADGGLYLIRDSLQFDFSNHRHPGVYHAQSNASLTLGPTLPGND